MIVNLRHDPALKLSICCDSTVADIRNAYVQAWKMGLKCVAIYRDGSKRSQPLNTKRTNEGGDKEMASSPLDARVKELEAEVARLREESGQPLRRCRIRLGRCGIPDPNDDLAAATGIARVGARLIGPVEGRPANGVTTRRLGLREAPAGSRSFAPACGLHQEPHQPYGNTPEWANSSTCVKTPLIRGAAAHNHGRCDSCGT